MAHSRAETDVTQSLRRIPMAISGEVALAVNARISDDDILVLDDGATVLLLEDDVINVALKGEKGNEFGPVFGKCTVKKKKSHGGGCRPVAVLTPNGLMPIPPVKEATDQCRLEVFDAEVLRARPGLQKIGPFALGLNAPGEATSLFLA